MKKKLLFLGGIMQQIPAIKRARELGYYVITCDYLPDNPGHAFANECHNVSTTDLDGVLSLARELKIDGIVAYASDPAAPTAAYVAEKLGLPGNPYESVKLLTEKDRFRDFLATHGFNCPFHFSFANLDEALHNEKLFRKVEVERAVVMTKPVDSSGSKGVVKVDPTSCDFKPRRNVENVGGSAGREVLGSGVEPQSYTSTLLHGSNTSTLVSALRESASYSRSGRIVVEGFIQKKGYQVSGDGFSVDGKLVFTSYGNELYSNKGTRDYVALGEFWPSLLTPAQREKVDAELQKLITALGMRTCAYNIEVILDKDDNVYILELGPRNGGSYIPQLIQYATGVDMVTATLQAAMGDLREWKSFDPPPVFRPLTEVVEAVAKHQAAGFSPSTTRESIAYSVDKRKGAQEWDLQTHFPFVSNYMIYSTKSGTFSRLAFDPAFERDNLLEVHCTAKLGDEVHAYQNTSHSLGTILFKASSLAEIQFLTANIEKYYQVVVG